MIELTIDRVIPAAQEKVFDAWLDAKALTHFMLPGSGMTVPKAETDPKVGGKFLIVMKAGDKEMPHSGEYREIDRPKRLAFTWVSPFTKTEQIVTLTFEPMGANQTKLTLHHAGFENEESRSNHHGGWSRILEVLQGMMEQAA